MRSAITAIAGAVILRCMVMTSIENEMPAMATGAARERGQYGLNASIAMCFCLMSHKLHQAMLHEKRGLMTAT